MDTGSSWLADLLVQLEAGSDIVGVAIVFGEDDVKSSSIFNGLDSTPVPSSHLVAVPHPTEQTKKCLLALVWQHWVGGVTSEGSETL